MEKKTEKKVKTIEEIFEISEREVKGVDVNSELYRQGCISVQTPNADNEEE